jgi:hypothetical protein
VRGDRRKGEVAQTMYRHVSKCKNDKIKKERKKSKNILLPVYVSHFTSSLYLLHSQPLRER